MRSPLYVVVGVLVITAVAIVVTILREKRRARQMAWRSIERTSR
jgi:uncharacterized membrane protein YsdA (DUF1294 family)